MTPASSDDHHASRWNTSRLWGVLQSDRGVLPQGYRPVLFTLLTACFVLRLGLGWMLPNIHHADEVYQVAEQANQSLYGYGIVPWEFRNASRPVLLPTLVKPIYRLNVSAATHGFLAMALFCALSLIPVWVAFHWAARLYGLRGAVLAAVMMATWFELVYFAPKPTVDAVCSYLFVAAIFLARPAARPFEACVAGALLMLTLALRVQIAPAVVIASALSAAIGGRTRTVALAVGAVLGLALAGAIEWSWWGSLFQGQRGYLEMEFTRTASAFFGREPLTFFAKEYVLMYGAALPLLVVLVWLGARKAPVLLLTAVLVIAPFHVVAHKEYRFVIAALPMLVLLMGLAAADLISRLNPASQSRAVSLVLAGWLAGMIAVSFGDHYRPYWTKNGNQVLAFREIGSQPDACGVGLVGIRWWHTPGYSGLGRDIPIYEITSDGQAARLLAAANYVLAATKATPPPAPFVRWREYTRPVQYLYRRPGGCEPDAAARVVHPPGIPGVQ